MLLVRVRSQTAGLITRQYGANIEMIDILAYMTFLLAYPSFGEPNIEFEKSAFLGFRLSRGDVNAKNDFVHEFCQFTSEHRAAILLYK